MDKISFAEVNIENNVLTIRKHNSKKFSNASDVEVKYLTEEHLYYVSMTSHKKIHVCTKDENGQSDVLITQIDNEDEEFEMNEDYINSLKHEVLELIQFDLDDLYIDKRKNQYTGEWDNYIFLRKGSYKSKELSKQEYWVSNILIIG